jgi:phosphoribosylformylglycinamidine cyclo-ligase
MSSAPRREGNAYKSAGVDYASLDAGKRLAQNAALRTSGFLAKRGGSVIEPSRGEPAFVFQLGGQTLALVLEGLGTKSVIARIVAEGQGPNRFRDVAYDAVAAIVNDLCCVGARPLVINAYFATGRPDWCNHENWYEELVNGWFAGCEDAGCTWGGGESPALPELVTASDIELAGSAVGVIPEGFEPLVGDRLGAGDEIVLVPSSGIHANGASLARAVAKELPDGYATALPSGASFGAALLEPSIIYSGLVESIIDAGLPITYLSHITGHGFLKLMRPTQELTYRITELPPVPEVLGFLVDHVGMSAHAAYSTFNMGAGFAIYCAAGSGKDVVRIAEAMGLAAKVAGSVEQGARRVIIEPVDVEYGGEELALAPDR